MRKLCATPYLTSGLTFLPVLGTVNNGPPKRINDSQPLNDIPDEVGEGLESAVLGASLRDRAVVNHAPSDRGPTGFRPSRGGGL